MIYREQISGKLVAYFKKKLGAKDYRSGWLKSQCPLCGKEDKFGIHVGKDRTNCFVCNSKLKPLDLILELEGFQTRKELWNFLRHLEDTDPFRSYVKPLEHKEVLLPEDFTLLNLGNGILAKAARQYWKGRGFNILDSALKGIGYCTKGKYGGCIILPFYSQGKLIYYIGRRFINNGEKFANPEVQEFGIGKSQIIYNLDSLFIYRKIQMVESYINALTLGDTASAILGKFASTYQKSIYLGSPVEEIEIILDPDAYTQSLKLALDLVLYKKVKVIRLPKDLDVNDIGRKETQKLIKKQDWQSHRELYKLWLLEQSKVEYEESWS